MFESNKTFVNAKNKHCLHRTSCAWRKHCFVQCGFQTLLLAKVWWDVLCRFATCIISVSNCYPGDYYLNMLLHSQAKMWQKMLALYIHFSLSLRGSMRMHSVQADMVVIELSNFLFDCGLNHSYWSIFWSWLPSRSISWSWWLSQSKSRPLDHCFHQSSWSIGSINHVDLIQSIFLIVIFDWEIFIMIHHDWVLAGIIAIELFAIGDHPHDCSSDHAFAWNINAVELVNCLCLLASSWLN